jgi:hypothetical protein
MELLAVIGISLVMFMVGGWLGVIAFYLFLLLF